MAVYRLLVAILISISSLPAAVKGQTGPPGPPPQCPEGKVYSTCGTACPRTCDNLGEFLPCSRQCVIGCFCRSGTVQNGDGGCVQPSDCPGQTTVLPSTIKHSPQTTTAIIAGSSAAAATVILLILILTVLLIAVFVRKANSKLDNVPSNKLKAQIANSGVTSIAAEKNLIPVEVNEAYAMTTHENIAYTTAERNDYEEYYY